MTSAVVWLNVSHTNMWRDHTATNMSACTTRRRAPDGVKDQAHAAEIGLQLPARLGVGERHGVFFGGRAAAFGAVAVQCPLGHHDAPAAEQVADFHDRQALVDQLLDGAVVGF